jgi:hypothetical protein
MNLPAFLCAAAAIAGFAVMGHCSLSHHSSEPCLHVRNEFQFTIHAPYDAAAPLFGAEAERAWAGSDWSPHFVYPPHDAATKDIPGAVFTIKHGHNRHASWINTAFDLHAGHVQYVYVLADAMVTLIDIHLAPEGDSATSVRVAYERTALTPDANGHVREFGESDRKSGPHWQSDFDNYFAKQKSGS